MGFWARFDRHGAEFLLAVAIALLLSACTSQVDKGYEMKVSLPVNGEVVFH
jgi:outer membrane biogenesis lipoprotein LolB